MRGKKQIPVEGLVLVSACLAGRACAYDGSARPTDPILELVRQGRAVLVCPEEDGGLPTPRPAAEIVGDRVITKDGEDVTGAYERGARIAVARAEESGCTVPVLKARSPSCGCGDVYDGSFSGQLRPGDGIAAAALKEAGVEVVSDEEL
jgi:uncharacterized protein YbbK (DUF523 family)